MSGKTKPLCSQHSKSRRRALHQRGREVERRGEDGELEDEERRQATVYRYPSCP